MKNNNKGFIAISLIYSFFLVFLVTLLMISASYAKNRVLLNHEKQNIQEYLNDLPGFELLRNPDLESPDIDKPSEIYKEDFLNGADPVLGDGMIPVSIGASSGNVYKTDITHNWYSYEKKNWANAVILVDGKSADDYKNGDQIPESDIESYFVWIPKYKYKLFDEQLGNYENDNGTLNTEKQNQAIEIEFGLENTKDDEETDSDYKECKTPEKSGDEGSCKEGMWMTHPAFLAFENTNGFWVGKFETSNSNITNKTTAQNHNNDTEAANIIIRPNVYSWRKISIGNAFRTSFNYKSDLQSHLMKNTEWGAVAYLAKSIYGKCTKAEDGVISCEEVYINNNSNYITGFSGATANKTAGAVSAGKSNSNSYNYNDINSVKASTTGNYTGIYDMSGGAREEVMAIMYGNDSTTLQYGTKSNFTEENFPKENKYYDIYNYNTKNDNYSTRILGDATGEVGPFKSNQSSFWNDKAEFVFNTNYYFIRGFNMTSPTNAGIFGFSNKDGSQDNTIGFRIVLSVEKNASSESAS